MRVLGLDFETTGFDTKEDRITEIGAVLWDTDTNTPLHIMSTFLYDSSYDEKFTKDIVDMMKRVSGITPEILKEFGLTPGLGLTSLEFMFKKYKAEAIVAHNGNNYDRPILLSELVRCGMGADVLGKCLWIDTRSDLPFEVEPDSRKLKHLALDCGFINPFAHRAVFDVLTMMRLFSQYPLDQVLSLAKQQSHVMRALVSFDKKDLAKAARYSWERLGELEFKKMWVKLVKESLVEKEIADCAKAGFQSVRIG